MSEGQCHRETYGESSGPSSMGRRLAKWTLSKGEPYSACASEMFVLRESG